MLSVKQGAGYTNFKVIGLTRLGIKPKSTAPEADALTTRPSELLRRSCSLISLYNLLEVDYLNLPTSKSTISIAPVS